MKQPQKAKPKICVGCLKYTRMITDFLQILRGIEGKIDTKTLIDFIERELGVRGIWDRYKPKEIV